MALTRRVIKREAEDTRTCEPGLFFLANGLMIYGKMPARCDFWSITGSLPPLRQVEKAFAHACRKAKLNNFRFHDRRHTFITNRRKVGVDQAVIMKLAGHQTSSLFQRYHTSDLEDAHQELEELLGKEQEWGATRTEMCSLVLPREETAELEL